MKKTIVFSVMLMSGAAWAQAPASDPAAVSANDPNQIVCQSVTETGSRLHHSRVCKTRAEWAQLRRETQSDVERSQALRGERPAN